MPRREQNEPRQPQPAGRPAGTPREAQDRVIEKAARQESWLEMLRRERREAKGRPRRWPWPWPWLRRGRRADDED